MQRERILAWVVLVTASAAFAANMPRTGCGPPTELEALRQKEDTLCRRISTLEAHLRPRQKGLNGGPADAEYRELVRVRDRISDLEGGVEQ